MAVGTGAKYLSNLPAQPFEINPGLFFELTQPDVASPRRKAYPGPATPLEFEIPHANILSHITLAFEGTVAGEIAGAAADPLWAYAIIKRFRFSGAGSTDLQVGSGRDLHTLRFIRNPALNRGTEFFNTSPDENGNFRVVWDIPIAADMTTLIGSVWAQGQAQQLTLEITTATLAELGITQAGATITGNFILETFTFTPPYGPDGRLVIPDLSRVHGLIARDTPFAATGDVPATLYPFAGSYMRLLSLVDLGSATAVANPTNYAATTPSVDKHVFKYGAKQTPYEYDPAWLLAKRNGDHYGSALPQGYVCLDLVRENAIRDTIISPGITDAEWISTIRAGTALAAGSRIHTVQEVQYFAV